MTDHLPTAKSKKAPSFADGLLKRVYPGVVILLVWLVCWWPVVSGQAQLFLRDLTFYTLPMKHAMMARLAAGEFPFWTPDISTGMPFFAEPTHQVLYPFNLLFFLTPTVVHGISWFVILHALLAMGAFYWLGRVLGCGRVVALWGGLLYGLSGYTLSVTDNVNYLPATLWVPLVLGCFIRGLEASKLRYTALTALCVCMMLLAGDTLNPFYLGVFCTVLVGLRCKIRELFAGSRILFTLAHLGLSFGLAGLMAAVQLLPTWELLTLSVRQTALSFDEVTLWSFPPQRLIEFIQPFFYGSKYPQPHFLGQFFYPGFREPWADTVYIGIIPVLFALGYAVVRMRSAVFWLVIIVVSLLLSFGAHAAYYPLLLKVFPPLSFHRYQEKFVFWTNLAVCVMAMLGARSLLEVPDRLAQWTAQISTGKRAVITVAWMLGSLFLLVKIPTDLWTWPHALERGFEWGVHFYERGPHVLAMAHHWILLSALVVVPFWVQPACLRSYQWFLLVVALLDLGYYHIGHFPVGPTSLMAQRPVPAAAAMIRAEQPTGHPRIFYDDMVDYEEYQQERRTLDRIAQAYRLPELTDNYQYYWVYRVLYNQNRLLFNMGVPYRLRYLNGRFAPLQPRNHKLMDMALTRYAPDLLMSLSGVDFIVTPIQPRNTRWDGDGFTEIGRDIPFNLRVLRVENRVARAYLSPNALPNCEPMVVYKMLTKGFSRTQPQRQVEISPPDLNPPVLTPQEIARQPEPKPLQAIPELPSRVTVAKDAPEQLALEIDSPYPQAWLVVTESFFPGWTARVDGRPAEVHLANQRFMAVSVLKGRHHVVLSYRSTYFLPGLCLSVLGLLLAAGLLIVPMQFPGEAKPPAPKRAKKHKPARGKAS